MDAQAQATRDRLGTATGLVLDQVPGPDGLVGTVLWEAGKFGVNQGLDVLVDGDVAASHAARLEAQAVRVARLQDAVVAQLVVANDPRHAAGLPSALRSPTGGLIDPVRIIDSPALDAEFAAWMVSTNVDASVQSTYDSVTDAAGEFHAGFGRVQAVFGRA
ncbi:hypothetical protein J1G42_02905 [Cellulomonas sp. zg-ZUI222]|uniref:Uncharacterized protein n=1 Tax=Cellulomonas wangleii TaxID=2816956 RepID=A0ABX8D3S0_9CELL|nr:hypothetical protein [Cellulomonas wangleii]MBO0919774.1 hypothetical protein [Cellulomonas wangleii]MBO0923801.1 hypothetical protein [Cellulomonas wangleii]MBO0924083.1 hypothetical protein [Cellulomonas wangleii]QVI62108.1 hypothetical protein KG103_17110 [Cellulomonas wangleii]